VALSIAFSPCPNDTFVFHALIHGRVAGTPDFEVTYADVDVTNNAALDGGFDLVKVSYAALPWLLDSYTLLPCGGAVGRGCGPLVLTNNPAVTDLTGKTVVVPGDRTTAYVLMRLWAKDQAMAPARIDVRPFHEIMPAVADGRYDAGLVIHEARFTYTGYGLCALADLGEWWEKDTGLPIPLGAILARRGRVDAEQATGWIRESVRLGWEEPQACQAYVLRHAQEMRPDVVERHIALYVNEFTADLGDEGYAAAEALLDRAHRDLGWPTANLRH